MFKKILPIFLSLAFLLGACGPLGTPTMSAEDSKNTAVAEVWTLAAETQLAKPSETPLPPTATETPMPTFTATVTPAPVTDTATAVDPNTCNKALSMGEAGPMKNIRLENENKSDVNLSLSLYRPNEFGQCGYISFVLKSGEKRKVGIPSGYWSAYSWVLNPPSQASTSFFIGASGSDDLLRIVVKKDVIAWVGP